METNWVVPELHPSIVQHTEGTGLHQNGNFHKLHAFGLADYDSVVYLDTDVRVAEEPGALRPLFDCAASGYVMSTRGVRAPANGGVLA